MKEWDRNGDGDLSRKEFQGAVRQTLRKMKMSDAELATLYDESFDPEGKGEVLMSDLKPAIKELAEFCKAEVCAMFFHFACVRVAHVCPAHATCAPLTQHRADRIRCGAACHPMVCATMQRPTPTAFACVAHVRRQHEREKIAADRLATCALQLTKLAECVKVAKKWEELDASLQNFMTSQVRSEEARLAHSYIDRCFWIAHAVVPTVPSPRLLLPLHPGRRRWSCDWGCFLRPSSTMRTRMASRWIVQSLRAPYGEPTPKARSRTPISKR